MCRSEQQGDNNEKYQVSGMSPKLKLLISGRVQSVMNIIVLWLLISSCFDNAEIIHLVVNDTTQEELYCR